MPRFRYPLQPAVDRAIVREREALVAVARAEAVVRAERRALSALDRGLDEVVRGGARGVGRRDIAPWLDVATHAAALGKLRTACKGNVAVACGNAADSRAAHAVVRRLQCALVRHRELRYAAFLVDCERREAAELDEMSALCRKAAARRIGK